MVDTGATTLIINKDLFQQLGLDVMEEREITFANDTKEICKLTEPVEIHWQDHFVAMSALVVEDASEVLLGVLPLEGMDLMVDTVNDSPRPEAPPRKRVLGYGPACESITSP
jgi:clan AA aspartic protease